MYKIKTASVKIMGLLFIPFLGISLVWAQDNPNETEELLWENINAVSEDENYDSQNTTVLQENPQEVDILADLQSTEVGNQEVALQSGETFDFLNVNGTLSLHRHTGHPSVKAAGSDQALILDSSGSVLSLNNYVADDVWIAKGGGNVGIGTTAPTRKLHVNGSAEIGGTNHPSHGNWHTLILGDREVGDGKAGLLFNPTNQTDGMGIFYDSNNDEMRILDWKNVLNTMVIKQNGNVGIGRNRPADILKLDVQGAVGGHSFSVFNPLNSAGYNGASVNLNWSNHVSRIRVGGNGIGAGNGLDIQTVGNVSMMRIKPSGVGVGTTSPTEKLDVAGNIKLSGNIVSDGDICFGACQ